MSQPKSGQPSADSADTTPDIGAEHPGDSGARKSARHRVVLVAAGVVAVGGAGVLAVLLGASRHTGGAPPPASAKSATYTFVVPAGTAAKVARGERVDVFPTELDVRVGDRLVVRNEDSQAQTVGPIFIRPGETAEETFSAPGTIQGECSVHPNEKFTIRVAPS